MADQLIRFDHIVKRFHVGTPDETTLFDGFDFGVDEGEFISIVGSNGSGKTTLLNLLCGSLPLDAGRLYYRNRDITRLPDTSGRPLPAGVPGSGKGSCPDLTIWKTWPCGEQKGPVFPGPRHRQKTHRRLSLHA